MSTTEDIQLVVSGPLHNNEPTGAEVVTYVKLHPIDGVLPYLVPHEAAPGERFKGISELGEHFTDNKNPNDPEDRVAAQMEIDLKLVAKCLGIDIHDTPMKNANRIIVGNATTPEQLALALVLELNKVEVMYNYPYFRRFPRFTSVETTRDLRANPPSCPEYWYVKLGSIVDIGIGGLRRIFAERKDELTYFGLTYIPLIGKSALTMEQIEELEHIPFSGKAFEEVTLPPEIAEHLGLDNKVTRIGAWGYAHNAKPRPDLGVTHDGRQRREFFGKLFVEIDPPIATSEATLQFAQNGRF